MKNIREAYKSLSQEEKDLLDYIAVFEKHYLILEQDPYLKKDRARNVLNSLVAKGLVEKHTSRPRKNSQPGYSCPAGAYTGSFSYHLEHNTQQEYYPVKKTA